MIMHATVAMPAVMSLATPLSAQTLAQVSMLVNVYRMILRLEADPATRRMHAISSPAIL
jgi:hypothetical protein